MSILRAPWVPTPYVAGAGPDLLQARHARDASNYGITADAVRQTTQTRPARIARADFVSPQADQFPHRTPLGLADAAVGVQLDWPSLPGRLPPGGLPPGVVMATPKAAS